MILGIEGQVNTLFLCHITNHAVVFVILIKRVRSEHLNRYGEKRECNSALPLFVAHPALVYDITGNLMPSMAIIDVLTVAIMQFNRVLAIWLITIIAELLKR